MTHVIVGYGLVVGVLALLWVTWGSTGQPSRRQIRRQRKAWLNWNSELSRRQTENIRRRDRGLPVIDAFNDELWKDR